MLIWAMTRKEFFLRLRDIMETSGVQDKPLAPGTSYQLARLGSVRKNINYLITNCSEAPIASPSARSCWLQVRKFFHDHSINPWPEFKDEVELKADLENFFKKVGSP